MAVNEAVAEAAEAVADEATDVAEVARAVTGRELRMLFGGLAAGLASGFTIGYAVLNKKLQTKYEQIADQEISDLREHYFQKVKNLEEKPDLGKVVEELGYTEPPAPQSPNGQIAYHRIGSEPDKVGAEGEDESVQNVFENEEPDVEVPEWDYAEEVKSRTPFVPYVIHRDEHREGPEGREDWEQVTLTYFEGDDVLSDERDQVLSDQDEVVGLGNLSKFGHGSGDPNIVYIRNEKLKVDIELVHSDGRFATEVHGFPEDELQHSMKRRLPRRSEYDQSG